MSWSYDPTLLTDKDKVRLLVKDTVETAQLVEDEAILFLLEEEGQSLYRAAAAACRTISLHFARQASLIDKESGLHDDMQKKADAYRSMADEYEQKGGRSGLTVFAGGISLGDKETRAGDSDASPPAFRRDLHQSASSTTPSLLNLP